MDASTIDHILEYINDASHIDQILEHDNINDASHIPQILEHVNDSPRKGDGRPKE